MMPALAALALLLSCQGPQGGDDTAAVGCPVATVQVVGQGLSLSAGACGELLLEPRVLGEGTLTLAWAEQGEGVVQPVLTAGEDGATWTGLALEGTWTLDGAQDPVLLRQGYQSWSWSGVEALVGPALDGEGLPVPGGDGDGLSVVDEAPGTSWWGGLVGRPDGASFLLGATRARESRVYVAADPDTAWVVWGHRGEEITLAAGQSLALDPLFLDLGADPLLLLDAWATAVAAAVPPRPLGEQPPTGWATWYQYYSEVTEAEVQQNLAVAQALASRGDLAPLQVFQLDDGWQVRWGDWTAGDDFPSGMAALAAQIQDAGMTPGLWMAPFYVSRDSATYAAHPDWWVKDQDGVEIRFSNLGTGDYAIVDATHPDAGAWMAQQVADRVAEGWTYLKLDFLYAGAQEGQRHADVTGIQAYQHGMALLREAAGDAWVLACGAPLLPSVGWAEQFRTGADIAFEISPDPDPAYLRWQARSTAARSFTNGRWWWVDPDQLILREPFDPVRARGAVVAQAVSGGAWLLGDDLAALPEDRLALALHPAAVALRGQSARPQAPLSFPSGLDASPTVERLVPDDQVPLRWTFPDGTVALLNLSDDPVEVDGPGGVELLTGEQAAAAPRTLAPGQGELWGP
ncbi:alpha-galactosidase [Myxococcota bacterium]|nr:alpha-galactosidase [Myxococcota bacterium]